MKPMEGKKRIFGNFIDLRNATFDVNPEGWVVITDRDGEEFDQIREMKLMNDSTSTFSYLKNLMRKPVKDPTDDYSDKIIQQLKQLQAHTKSKFKVGDPVKFQYKPLQWKCTTCAGECKKSKDCKYKPYKIDPDYGKWFDGHIVTKLSAAYKVQCGNKVVITHAENIQRLTPIRPMVVTPSNRPKPGTYDSSLSFADSYSPA